ncbi:hypothetical protein Tco_0704562 [Tanacetum coccineum]|uniref:Uncharacterized protein n=1 Tax=Tanacetum coccineum TaxID=301880 RepID=A0ABQ4Y2X9_9ASTR
MRKPGMFRIAPPQGITRTPQLPHALGTLIFTCLKSSGVIHTTSLLANTDLEANVVPISASKPREKANKSVANTPLRKQLHQIPLFRKSRVTIRSCHENYKIRNGNGG